MTPDTPQPPSHLSKATAAWFRDVIGEFNLEPHHVRLLTLAGEAWDRCVAARQAIEQFGLTQTDRFGQAKARPEIAIERDSRIAFVRTLRELGLDHSEPGDNRPPALHGNGTLKKGAE
jgi:phage terminase small subunit